MAYEGTIMNLHERVDAWRGVTSSERPTAGTIVRGSAFDTGAATG
jgi:hypothetical protein